MKKLISSCLITSTLVFSPAIQAQEPSSPRTIPKEEALSPNQDFMPPDLPLPQHEAPIQDTPPSAQEATTPELTPSTDDENEGTPVGQAASEGSNAAKKRRWQNIALAAGAVAVAITALILVANNDGHSSKKD